MTPTAADAATYLEAQGRNDLAGAVYRTLADLAAFRTGAEASTSKQEPEPAALPERPRNRRVPAPSHSPRVLYMAFQLGEAFPKSIPTRVAAKARMGWTSNNTTSKAIRALREMRGTS